MDIGYIDLLLLHRPYADVMVSWSSLIKLFDVYSRSDLIQYIGVSNYDISHLEHIKQSNHRPYVNQIEISPFLPRHPLITYCQQNQINIMAHSSLTQGKMLNAIFLSDIIAQFSELNQYTPATLLLKWALQNNYTVLPRSNQYPHIKENFFVPKTCLSDEIMSKLNQATEKFSAHPQHITKSSTF